MKKPNAPFVNWDYKKEEEFTYSSSLRCPLLVSGRPPPRAGGLRAAWGVSHRSRAGRPVGARPFEVSLAALCALPCLFMLLFG